MVTNESKLLALMELQATTDALNHLFRKTHQATRPNKRGASCSVPDNPRWKVRPIRTEKPRVRTKVLAPGNSLRKKLGRRCPGPCGEQSQLWRCRAKQVAVLNGPFRQF
jgi:hypothetical protein